MNNQVLPAGSRVCVTSYGPFRGLKGTIRNVDTIPGLEAGEAFCFYLVELEGKHIKESIWFECDEVELVDCNLQMMRGTLLMGLGLDQLSRVLTWLKPHIGKIEIGTGIVMIAAGVIIFFNLLPYFNHYFNLGINV